MRSLLSVLAALIALTVVGIAGAGPKEQFVLYHDFGVGAYCDGSGVTRPDAPQNPGWTVTFDAKKDTITATIKVKNGITSPYLIRLIQGPHDCRTDEVTYLLTRPNATIKLSEAITGDFAFVHLDQIAADPVTGEWLDINSSLVSETFRH
jgi:hypothetical protein